MSTLDNKYESLQCSSCSCIMFKTTLCKALYALHTNNSRSIRCSYPVCPNCEYCTQCSDTIYETQKLLKKYTNNPNANQREKEIERLTKLLRNQYRISMGNI